MSLLMVSRSTIPFNKNIVVVGTTSDNTSLKKKNSR